MFTFEHCDCHNVFLNIYDNTQAVLALHNSAGP